MNRSPLRRGHSVPPACSALHEDDGVDPRRLLREPANAGSDRKTLQACGQAARALSLAFAGILGDEVLASLDVVSVAPAPDASRLRVVVSSRDVVASVVVAARLAAALPMLRAEVAQTLRRRRVPDLVFDVARERDAEARP
jgi:hypothetical protein